MNLQDAALRASRLARRYDRDLSESLHALARYQARRLAETRAAATAMVREVEAFREHLRAGFAADELAEEFPAAHETYTALGCPASWRQR